MRWLRWVFTSLHTPITINQSPKKKKIVCSTITTRRSVMPSFWPCEGVGRTPGRPREQTAHCFWVHILRVRRGALFPVLATSSRAPHTFTHPCGILLPFQSFVKHARYRGFDIAPGALLFTSIILSFNSDLLINSPGITVD